MAISQAKRTELHQELREKLTVDTADTLMDHLPPDGWSEVATKPDLHTLEVALKSDLHTLEVALKSDLHTLEVALKADIAMLQAETTAKIAALQAETKADIAALQVETKADIAALQAETKADIAALQASMLLMEERINSKISNVIAKQNKWMTSVLASLVVAMIVALLR